MAMSFSEIVDQAHELDSASKEELIGLLRSWLAEDRRREIAHNAREARSEYAQGKLKSGNVDDLMADMYAKD